MSEKIEEFEINCPICDKTHTYPVAVDSSLVMYRITGRVDTSPIIRRFKRAFICPENEEMFQATIKITQRFGQMIHDVNVK